MAISGAEKTRKLRQKRIAAGLCMSCGKRPPVIDNRRCDVCRASHSTDSKKRHDARRAAGLCYCGKLAVDGFKICEEHKEAALTRYDDKVVVGNCGRCGEPSDSSRCEKCGEIAAAANRKHRKKLRDQVFTHYGDKCVCCDETEPLFLTIDHINNDGAAHRRSMPNGRQATSERIYRWLRDNNFPDGFQILCMNCNLGKQRNGGTCPHAKLNV